MAAKRTVKRTDDELRAILRAVPQRIVGQMCGGRQTVQLQRVDARWSFPISGRSVDMFAVMARLWDFLKKFGPMLQMLMEDTGEGGDENALGVRYLKARIAKTEEDAAMAKLRRQLKEGTILDQAVISMGLDLMADRIRQAGEQAQRQWGADGFELFDDLLNGFQSDIQRLLGDKADEGGLST